MNADSRGPWRHLHALWPGWSILAPLPFVLHALWSVWRGSFHVDNAIVLLLVAALFSIGPRSKRLFLGIYPIGLVGLFYDTMRAFQQVGVTPDRVHLCGLRDVERSIFGLTMDGQRVTFHDWFQAHPSAVLDAVCAIPYGTFIFVCIACAIWLYLRDYPRMLRFTWCFFALNVAGFVTYHVFPAAPPWYFHAHGCTVDMLTRASEGPALARVDARLGLHYFAGMYGRSASVFGAMPSLHCAYPLLVVLEGWRSFSRPWRAASVAFSALMVFSAVYLDHHWVLDAIVGMTYCVVIVTVARAWQRRRQVPAGASLPARGAP